MIYFTAPYEHQRTAVRLGLENNEFAFFMEMGTGKSKVALDIFQNRRAEIPDLQLIVFCPNALQSNWRDEITKHCRAADGIHIFSLHNLSSSDDHYLRCLAVVNSYAHVMTVVDEAHRVKNPAAKRSKRVYNLVSKARFRYCLTGTPLTRSFGDLWGVFATLNPLANPTGYKSLGSMETSHMRRDPVHKWKVFWGSMDKVLTRVKACSYQVRLSECLDLPEKIYKEIELEMNYEQRCAYERTKNFFLDAYYMQEDDYLILRMLTRLQMISSGISFKDEIAGESLVMSVPVSQEKLDYIQSIEEELPSHTIIWCKYLDEVRFLSANLRGSFVMTGEQKLAEREKSLASWRRHGGPLIATMATGGEGLTLTEATTVIFYSSSFNYAERIQAEARCHRIGQHRAVNYITLSMSCGIDQMVARCLGRKENLAEYVKRHLKRDNHFLEKAL